MTKNFHDIEALKDAQQSIGTGLKLINDYENYIEELEDKIILIEANASNKISELMKENKDLVQQLFKITDIALALQGEKLKEKGNE